MTSDEMKQRNIATMGEALGKQYSALFHEITALHLYWNEFIELFGTNDARIKRLNQTAPGFFQMLQEQQFETNMSHMARLTDSPKSMGKENLTVRSLPDLVTDQGLKDKTRYARKLSPAGTGETAGSPIMISSWRLATGKQRR